jgi:hypothetical protein
LKKEYKTRIGIILKSELHVKKKITSIGILDVVVLSCTSDVINWRLEEITKTNKKIRNVLTMYCNELVQQSTFVVIYIYVYMFIATIILVAGNLLPD